MLSIDLGMAGQAARVLPKTPDNAPGVFVVVLAACSLDTQMMHPESAVHEPPSHAMRGVGSGQHLHWDVGLRIEETRTPPVIVTTCCLDHNAPKPRR
jgi:hypothetical protein